MDLDTLVPAGGGSLSRPVLGPRRQIIGTFTPAQTPDPGDLWEPLTRTTGITAGGQQGDPFGGYRPGHGLEHEPLDSAEKAGQHTAQSAYSFAETAGQVRAALRPGSLAVYSQR